MRLNDFLTADLSTIIKDCSIIKLSPISDNDGNIVKIIVEYVPSN